MDYTTTTTMTYVIQRQEEDGTWIDVAEPRATWEAAAAYRKERFGAMYKYRIAHRLTQTTDIAFVTV
jgi:hypothetical protein